MKRILFGLVLILIFSSLAYAEIPIYCPHEKKLLYYYQKDEIVPGDTVMASDFKPASESIPQPKESELMICPICKCPLNIYEAWAWEREMKPPVFHVWAISFLTKDKEGNFIGYPYDLIIEDWEGKQ